MELLLPVGRTTSYICIMHYTENSIWLRQYKVSKVVQDYEVVFFSTLNVRV